MDRREQCFNILHRRGAALRSRLLTTAVVSLDNCAGPSASPTRPRPPVSATRESDGAARGATTTATATSTRKVVNSRRATVATVQLQLYICTVTVEAGPKGWEVM